MKMKETSRGKDKKPCVNNKLVIYGISASGLADLLGCSKAKAQQYLDNYLRGYPKVCDFISQAEAFLDKYEYTPTLNDRKRRIPEVHAAIEYESGGIKCTRPDNFKIAGAKRQGVNAIIQGSAGEVMKLAIIKVSPILKKYNCYLILTIHDELLIEIPEEYATEDSDCVKEIIAAMESAVKLDVPLVADFDITDVWQKG